MMKDKDAKEITRKQLEDRIKFLEEQLDQKRQLNLSIDRKIQSQNARLIEVVDTMKKYIVGDNIQLDFLKDLCKTFIDAMDNINTLDCARVENGGPAWRLGGR